MRQGKAGLREDAIVEIEHTEPGGSERRGGQLMVTGDEGAVEDKFLERVESWQAEPSVVVEGVAVEREVSEVEAARGRPGERRRSRR